MHPHRSLCTLDYHWVLRVVRAFTIGNPLGCRGSVCVEVMTTLHGSAPSLQRCAEGCVPSEGTIAFARDFLKSTYIFLEPLWPYRMNLDHLIRISSSHVGAHEGLQSLFGYSLDPMFSLLVSSWECSEIGTNLSISWITFCHVTLDYSFHSMSLACFLLRAFVFLSWLGTPFHFVVTH